MGAMMTHLVVLLRFIEQQNLSAEIKFTNPLYGDDANDNWLPKYFKLTDNSYNSDATCFNITNSWDSRMLGADSIISLSDASSIFSHKVQFTEQVENAFNSYLAETNMPKETLGIHFRGTDKASEALLVNQNEMLDAMRLAIDENDIRHIFLATDEPTFQKKVIKTFGANMISSYYQPGIDIESGGPIHFSNSSGEAKAIDALMNIRLLASCPQIIRTASFMSGWAKVLNPNQQVMLLNKLSSNNFSFPDTEIAELMRFSKGSFVV